MIRLAIVLCHRSDNLFGMVQFVEFVVLVEFIDDNHLTSLKLATVRGEEVHDEHLFFWFLPEAFHELLLSFHYLLDTLRVDNLEFVCLFIRSHSIGVYHSFELLHVAFGLGQVNVPLFELFELAVHDSYDCIILFGNETKCVHILRFVSLISQLFLRRGSLEHIRALQGNSLVLF